MTSNTTFIHTNNEPPSLPFFQGYCFSGSDFVYEQEGADQLLQAEGRGIQPGLDGKYVLAQKYEDSIAYDVDYAGYCILYYFHDGDVWAVSNSFAQTVDYLRSQKITIKPNYTHLAAAAGGRGMAASQLFSLETLVHGIRVVPRTHSLHIMSNKAVLHRRASHSAEATNYAGELSNYLESWVSRFETLLTSDNADFTAALTGGLDSRVNFALIQAARNRIGESAGSPNLYCGSTPTNRIDLQVAESVARHYGLAVRNGRRPLDKPLSAEESFEQYRSLALGTYYPLYMPANGPSVMDINISGGGGGVHRKIYEAQNKSKDHQAFIRRYARNFKRNEYRVEFIHDAHNFLRTVMEPGDDPLVSLLREGRVRYHTGRASRYGVSLSPLNSLGATRTQLLAGTARIEEAQFHYDVLNSLFPELLSMPFDDDSKAPSQTVLDGLTSASITTDANPGRVWAASNEPVKKVDDSLKSRIAVYDEAFQKSASNAFVRNFLGDDVIKAGQDKMAELTSGKGYGNPANGKAISVVLATDLVKPV